MFTEISGTMWSVFLMKDGRPFQRLLLTAPSAAAAQDQARIVAGRHYRADVSDAEGVLLAICRPRNRITSFTYIPSGATPNAEQIVADYAQRNKPVVEHRCQKHGLLKRLLPMSLNRSYDRYECPECRREWNQRETERRRARRAVQHATGAGGAA